MRTRNIVVAAAFATGLFVTGATAQHEEHHGQAAPSADKADTGKMGGMMSGNMMTQMPKMMMGQTETSKLIDQLTKSFAAIEAEKDQRPSRRNSASTARCSKNCKRRFSSNRS